MNRIGRLAIFRRTADRRAINHLGGVWSRLGIAAGSARRPARANAEAGTQTTGADIWLLRAARGPANKS
jgi:hypothetical protein